MVDAGVGKSGAPPGPDRRGPAAQLQGLPADRRAGPEDRSSAAPAPDQPHARRP